ncbi:DUF6714 family protein [Aeoliella sp. SH292]|uniref:DUF6714 family protein n=1 Tax=Aeoliella sp. SH292 TaxID=3454464 RepID=UPI003F9BE0BB
MTEEQTRVANLIREAFQGVVLGNGVGLFQGQAIDDYASEAEEQALRAKDEKLDWAKISFVDLNGCSSSLSFFDAEGMRFHLPAYLISDLEETGMHDITFDLFFEPYDAQSRFNLLDTDQRLAVREFLLLKKNALKEAGDDFAIPSIDQALENYWKPN